MDKNRNNLTVKIKKSNLILLLLTGIPALLLLASCNGVVPEPLTPPGPDDDPPEVYYMTNLISPFFEKEEEDKYCWVASSTICTNYTSGDPTKTVTQKEVAEATLKSGYVQKLQILLNQKGIQVKVMEQVLNYTQFKKMLNDDIAMIAIFDDDSHAIIPLGCDTINNTVTIYNAELGVQAIMPESSYFNYMGGSDNLKVDIFIKDTSEVYSIYLNNLSKLTPSNVSFELA